MELSDDVFVELVEFETGSSQQQDALIDAIARETREWVASSPGFIAAALHRSEDGERVVNYAQWRSRADWQRFTDDDRAAGPPRRGQSRRRRTTGQPELRVGANHYGWR